MSSEKITFESVVRCLFVKYEECKEPQKIDDLIETQGNRISYSLCQRLFRCKGCGEALVCDTGDGKLALQNGETPKVELVR